MGDHIACRSMSSFSEYSTPKAGKCRKIPSGSPEIVALILSGVIACAAIDVRVHKKHEQMTCTHLSSDAREMGLGTDPYDFLMRRLFARYRRERRFSSQLQQEEQAILQLNVHSLLGQGLLELAGGMKRRRPYKPLDFIELLTTHVRYTSLVNSWPSPCTSPLSSTDWQLTITDCRKDVASVLKNEYPNGVDVAYEGVGGKMLQAALLNLHPQGRLLSIGYISQYPHAKSQEASAPIADGLPSPENLFWKGMTVKRGGQVLMGSTMPKVSRG